MPKPWVDPTSGISSGDGMIPIGIRHVGGAKHNQAFVWNVRSCSSMPREKPQAVPQHRSELSLTELAAMYNPCIRGWIAYYSHFYRRSCIRPSRGSMPMSFDGPPQVQADAPSNQRRTGLVRSLSAPLCALGPMPWQRPNIGSRVTRDGHARF